MPDDSADVSALDRFFAKKHPKARNRHSAVGKFDKLNKVSVKT
jgi:hypothetical protein